MNYSVTYGVNNSHMSEIKFFKLYRDSISFYEALDGAIFKAKAIIKLHYDNSGFVQERETKLFKFESGTSNTKMLELARLGLL